MPALFPLAADLGDLIFLLVVLGGGLIQWLASRNKKNQEPDTGPYEDPFPREEFPSRGGTEQPEPSWDELMEALGQRPGQVRPEQVAPPPLPVPAAAPASPPPIRVFPPQPEAEPALSDHVRSMLAAMESRTPSPAAAYETERNFPKAGERPPSARHGGLAAALRNRSELRRAVILQEILQPPLALR